MNLSALLQKVEASPEYKSFKKASPDATLCAGFFILDFKEQRQSYALDYITDSGKDLFSFNYDLAGDTISMKQEELIQGQKKLEEVNPRVKVEIEDLKNIVEEELKKNKILNKLEKIIAVLQNENEKTIWNLTCMCDGFAIIMVHVDSKELNILKFEKKSLFDFVSVKKGEKGKEGKKENAEDSGKKEKNGTEEYIG